MTADDAADYIVDNMFDPSNLTWEDDNGKTVITLSDDQWDLAGRVIAFRDILVPGVRPALADQVLMEFLQAFRVWQGIVPVLIDCDIRVVQFFWKIMSVVIVRAARADHRLIVHTDASFLQWDCSSGGS